VIAINIVKAGMRIRISFRVEAIAPAHRDKQIMSNVARSHLRAGSRLPLG
jgi:hypothetical protein